MGDRAIFTERERNGELVRDVAPAPAVLPCWHCGADVPVEVPKAICPSCTFHNWLSYGGRPVGAYCLLPSRTMEGAYR